MTTLIVSLVLVSVQGPTTLDVLKPKPARDWPMKVALLMMGVPLL
jgi:hypothetical protein